MSSYDRARTRAHVSDRTTQGWRTEPTAGWRRRGLGLLALLLGTSGLVLLPAAQASAVFASFTCTSNTVYALESGTGVVVKVTSTSGASTATSNADFGSGNYNALALAGAGTEIWAFDRSNNKVKVARVDHTDQTWNMPNNSLAGNVVAGAINPATGIYYYAAGGSTWTVFAFNTLTKTSIGQVATISGTGLGGNGDFAFDATGNLFVVSSDGGSSAGTLARVNGALPTTAGSTALGLSVLTATPANNGTYHSMAFDSSGHIVIGTSTPKIIRVNPTTGAIVDSSAMGFGFVDLASCASPSTAQAQVDLPAGRHTPGDQFTVTITGNGLSSGNTGTTAGTDTGLQGDAAEKAGPAVVLPGQTYTVTQTAAGTTTLANYATTWSCANAAGTVIASGTGQTGTFTVPAGSGSAVTCTFTNTPLRPAITLDKTASAAALGANGRPDPGDTITYGFKVTNTGNIPLSAVTVHDPLLSGANPNITCPATTLAVGASMTCTSRTYSLTQSDVDGGAVANTATAGGTGSNGVKVTSTDSTTTPLAAFPGLELDKTASPIADTDGNGHDVGDTIAYGFTVTNTGNVTLQPVTVHDPRLGGSSPNVTCPTGSLAPGASRTCTSATYALTQADVDSGGVVNTATATGTRPGGGTSTATDTTTTPVTRTAAIRLDKTVSAISDLDANGADAGDRLTYGFKVTNTGNVTLDPVTVHDPLLSGASPNISCPGGALAPGASRTCTSRDYTLTQADVDAGKRDNAATATGTGPTGAKVTDTATTTSPIPAGPAISLVKSAGSLVDVDGNGADAGDTLTYAFTVTNTGTVTLNPVTVHDPLFTGASPTITCPTGPLAPGASRSCAPRTYTLTQADADAGVVTNTATATGTTPGGAAVTATDSTTSTVVAARSVQLDKTASTIEDLDGNGADAGDRVAYSFTVTNTGAATLNPVTVHDPRLGGTSPNVTCPTGPLAPGASRTCTTAAYTLTQGDVDAGVVVNTATATGTAPGGVDVTSSDTTTTTIAPLPGVRLTKTASAINDVDGNGPDAGDTLTYTFEVKNTGTVKLTSVTVSDPLLGGAPITCGSGDLAVGASVTCPTRTYTLTQADLDAGERGNTATATGTAPGGASAVDDDSVVVPIAGAPGIELTKTASAIDDVDGNGADAGDEITYGFRVRNTGTVVLDPVVVTDPLFADPTVSCGGAPLAPNAARDCDPVAYALTASDLDNGSVDNTATATGTTPGGATVSDSDSTSTPVAAAPVDLVVVKDVDVAQPYAGQQVTYTVTVRNDGGGSAAGVVLTDVLPDGVTFVSAGAPCAEAAGTVTCSWPTLAGGESRTVEITASVDPVAGDGPDHDHWLDVQKAEVQLDLEPGQERTLSVTCPTGYVATDGSGRIDHVDQGTGTLGSVGVSESRALGSDTWQVTARNGATGRAQAKVFTVCVKGMTEVVDGHAHPLLPGDVVTADVDLSSGTGTATLQCAPGTTPVRPGYVLDGVATSQTSYPSGSGGWTFAFAVGTGDATSGEVSVTCLPTELGEAAGHRHQLDLGAVLRTVSVAPGEVLEVTLTCADGSKGVVAGWDLDPGLVNLGNDPRPIIRVFKLYNPTSGPLSADLWLGCLGTRTAVADSTPTITNTASATTTSTESGTGNNADSASITVRPGAAPAVPASPRLTVGRSTVTASLACEATAECGGQASLVALRTQQVKGSRVRKGQVLAVGRYAVEAGERGRVVLKATRAGSKVLGRIGKAQLRLGGEGTTVTLR